VEKHNRYALYHPSAEAMSSMIVDLPYKITNSIVVNSTLYFMANLRREPGPFFYFMLVAFTTTLSMSMFFRLFASMTKTIEQALAPSSIMLLIMIMYTGFAIPVDYMKRYVYLHLKFLMLTVLVGRVGFDGSIQSLMALKA
jgi:ATP-binding cassette subfamily G (WHITE) protein 2 (PDR)